MTEISALPLIELVGPSPRTLLHRRLWGHKGLVISVALLTLIGLVALLAPVLAPYDPYAQDLGRRLIPPVWYQKGTWVHLLGTDNLGRDYLSRVLYGARISLLIGGSVMAISGLIGTTLGLAAGYFGGRVDAFVMFTTTVRVAMPLILVALAVVATVGGSLWVVVLVLGLLKWDRFAAVVGTDDRRRQGLHVLLVLADRDSRHGARDPGARHQHAGRRHPRRHRARREGLTCPSSKSTGSRSTSRRRAASCMRCATCRSGSTAARRCASSANPAAASR